MLRGEDPDIEDFGTCWYDDPETKTNGEFDCVVKWTGDLFDFYVCRYYRHPMTLAECLQEKEQLMRIRGIQAAGIGFVCTGGFAFGDANGFLLIDGAQLYLQP